MYEIHKHYSVPTFHFSINCIVSTFVRNLIINKENVPRSCNILNNARNSWNKKSRITVKTTGNKYKKSILPALVGSPTFTHGLKYNNLVPFSPKVGVIKITLRVDMKSEKGPTQRHLHGLN